MTQFLLNEVRYEIDYTVHSMNAMHRHIFRFKLWLHDRHLHPKMVLPLLLGFSMSNREPDKVFHLSDSAKFLSNLKLRKSAELSNLCSLSSAVYQNTNVLLSPAYSPGGALG